MGKYRWEKRDRFQDWKTPRVSLGFANVAHATLSDAQAIALGIAVTNPNLTPAKVRKLKTRLSGEPLRKLRLGLIHM